MKKNLSKPFISKLKHLTFVRGFTLIETLFAVLIFSASLVALIAVSARGLAATSTSREEIVARYLAQEGIEVVRNIRDTNYLNPGIDWLSAISDTCTPECHVVTGSGEAPGLAPDGNVPYYFDSTTGEYSTATGGSGSYRGTITVITSDSNPDEVKVISRIEWVAKGNRTRSVEYSNYLEHWR